MLQAELLGIEQKYLMDIGTAALLHNIGSLSFDHAQTKKGLASLTEDLDEHSWKNLQGARILLDSEGVSNLAAIAAFEHSIPYNLKGLPKRRFGRELNLVSMMIAIANYYDKLRRKPIYYEEGGPERIYKEMISLAGERFHPDLTNNFFTAIGVYPPGTLVELDSGEIGLVIQANILDVKRPQVEILYNIQGDKLEDPIIVNLMEKDRKGQYRWSIVKSIQPLKQDMIPEKYQ
jgi:HD-GYP domain-containing protein (c-di-GMP phosphodiesterase class II)